MAPNLSGMSDIDQPRAMYLVDLAMDFAARTLRTGGDLLMKVFQGEGFNELLQRLRQDYTTVLARKPEASRPRSREVYLLARGKK
jgi:23S rRNA (uridine2552-2'-O)-methyltransferase